MPKQVDARTGSKQIPAANFGALAKRYWYVLTAVGVVLAFVAWRFMQNRSAYTAGTDANELLPASGGMPLQPVSGTQPDMSNVIDMLSTQYQDLTNALKQQTQQTTPPSTASPFVSFAQWLQTPNRPDIAAALKKGKTQALQGEYVKEITAIMQRQATTPPSHRPGPQGIPAIGAGGAALWHATPPLAGTDVPFGTIAQTHRPLTSTGTMRALSGR